MAAYIAKHLAEAWAQLRPFRNFPRVKPAFDRLEKLFDDIAPGWQSPLQLSGRPSERVGVIPLALVLGITLKEALIMGGIALFAGVMAASAASREELEIIARDISESGRSGKPPPIKDPKGRQIDPWYVAPVGHAITAAIVALAALKGLDKVLVKVPKFPPPPKWIWAAVAIGALGVAGYYVHRKTQR